MGVSITSPIPARPIPAQVKTKEIWPIIDTFQLDGDGASSFRLQLGGLVNLSKHTYTS